MGLFFSTDDFAPIGSRFRRSLEDQFGLFEEDESWLNTGWEEPAAEEFTPLAEEYYPAPEEVPAPEPWVPEEAALPDDQYATDMWFDDQSGAYREGPEDGFWLPTGWPNQTLLDWRDRQRAESWPESPEFGTPDWSFLEGAGFPLHSQGGDIIDRRPALDPSVFGGISQMLTPWNDDGSRSMGGSFDGIGGRSMGGTWADEADPLTGQQFEGGGTTFTDALEGFGTAYNLPREYGGKQAMGILTGAAGMDREPIYDEYGNITGYTRSSENMAGFGGLDDWASGVFEGIQHPVRAGEAFDEATAGSPEWALPAMDTVSNPLNFVGAQGAARIAPRGISALIDSGGGAAVLGGAYGSWGGQEAAEELGLGPEWQLAASLGGGLAGGIGGLAIGANADNIGRGVSQANEATFGPGGYMARLQGYDEPVIGGNIIDVSKGVPPEEPWRPTFGEPNKATGAFGDGMTEGGRTTFGGGGSGTLPTPTPGWKMPDPDRFGMATEDQRIAVKDFNNFLEQERVLQATVGPEEISKGRSELAARLEAARKSADKNGLAGEQKANLVEAALREGSLRETLAIVPDSVRGEMDYMFDVAMRAYPNLPFENLRAIQTLREAFLTGNLEPRQYDVMRAIFGDVMPDFEKAIGKIADAKNPATSMPMDLGPEFTKPGKPPLIGEGGKLTLPEPGDIPSRVEGASAPIDTPARVREAIEEYRVADATAAQVERQAVGKSFTEWQATQSHGRGGVPLSPEKAAAEWNEWNRMLAASPKQDVAMKAQELRIQANNALIRARQFGGTTYRASDAAAPATGGKFPDPATAPRQGELIGAPFMGKEGDLHLPEPIPEGVYRSKPSATGPNAPTNTAKRYSELPGEMKAAIDKAATLEKQLLGDDYEAWARARSLKRGSGKELSAKGLEKQRKLWIAQLDDALETGAKLDASGREIGPHKYDDVLKAVEARRKVFDLEDQMTTVRSDLSPEFPASKPDTGGRQLELIPTLAKGDDSSWMTSIARAAKAAEDKLDSVFGTKTDVPDFGGTANVRVPEEAVSDTVKVWRSVVDVTNLPRALAATADISAPGRQGIVAAFADPKAWGGAWKKMFRAIASEDGFDGVQREINEMKWAPLRKKAGVYQAERGSDVLLTPREEAFMTRLAGKIPLIRGSERGYVAFMNYTRSKWFDDVVEKWEKSGTVFTEADAKSLASFINHATGRGDLSQGVAEAGSLFLFSPRNLVGRAQMHTDVLTSTPLVRKQVGKSLARFYLGGLATATALGGIAFATGLNDEFEWDPKKGKFGIDLNPTSGKFLKVQVGDRAYDLFGGNIQLIRPVAQFVTGQRLSADGSYRPADRSELFTDFVRSKLNPQTSVAVDSITGYDYDNNKLTGWEKATNALEAIAPLSAKDMYDEAKAAGLDIDLLAALAKTAPGFTGIGSVKDDPEWSNYNTTLESAWKAYTPEGYEKPATPQDDPYFMRQFLKDNPGILPEEDRGYGAEIAELSNANKDIRLANDELFRSGEKSVGDWKDTRRQQGRTQAALLSEARKRNEIPDKSSEKGTPGYWLETYLDVFDQSAREDKSLDNEQFDVLMAKWTAENGPEAVKYIQEWSKAGATDMEAKYLTAINQLSNDGYFPGEENSIPRFIGMSSDLSDEDLSKYRTILSNEKDKKGNEWMKDPKASEIAAFKVLRGYGLSASEITDVVNAGRDKYEHPRFTKYKREHKGLLEWLDNDNTWDVLASYE